MVCVVDHVCFVCPQDAGVPAGPILRITDYLDKSKERWRTSSGGASFCEWNVQYVWFMRHDDVMWNVWFMGMM